MMICWLLACLVVWCTAFWRIAKRHRSFRLACITLCLTAAVGAVVLGMLPGRVVAAEPNVLMIVVDDMNDWVGCLGGHPDVKTPNIDRLAARGMLFANAHCAAPVCNASRVATLTGRRPGSTGIYDNSARWHEAMPNVTSIPQHFKANG